MEKNKRLLIEQDKVSELSALTFNQHYDNSSENGFVYPLDENEELLVIMRLIASEDSRWFEFVQRYSQHYPLFQKSELWLVENIQHVSSQQILLQIANHYGLTPLMTESICKKILAEKCLCPEILEAICMHSRIFSLEAKQLLENIETRLQVSLSEKDVPHYAERYEQNTKAYQTLRK